MAVTLDAVDGFGGKDGSSNAVVQRGPAEVWADEDATPLDVVLLGSTGKRCAAPEPDAVMDLVIKGRAGAEVYRASVKQDAKTLNFTFTGVAFSEAGTYSATFFIRNSALEASLFPLCWRFCVQERVRRRKCSQPQRMAPAHEPAHPPKRRRAAGKTQGDAPLSSPASQGAPSGYAHEALQGEESFTVFSKGQLMRELEAKYGAGAEGEDEQEAVLKAWATTAEQLQANGGGGRRSRGKKKRG